MDQQLDHLFGVARGAASVIDVRAATDPNVLEKIVGSSTPGEDQTVNHTPPKKQKTEGNNEKIGTENEVGITACCLLFDLYCDHFITDHEPHQWDRNGQQR